MSDTGSDAQISPSVLIKSEYLIYYQRFLGVKKKVLVDIVEDLFSYNTIKRRRILEYYFFENATLSSPVMSTDGVLNIQ